MSPKRTSTTEERSMKRKQCPGLQKTTKPALSTRTTRARAQCLLDTSKNPTTPFRRSIRSSTKPPQARAERSPETATVHSNSLEPTQKPLTTSPNLSGPLQSAKRKRGREIDDEHEPLDKRQRTDSGSVVEWVQQLNEANLEEHNGETGPKTFNGMGDKKRTLSTRSSIADINQDVASASSQKAISLANYRWRNLDYARIVIEDEPIPKDIGSRVDAIIQPEVSMEWESELARITETFCDDFVDVLKGASREDDSVEPIHRALTSIDRENDYMFPRKADWDVTLKPDVQRKTFHLDIPARPDNAADDSFNRPSKRQQAETSYASPDNSEPTMPPPQPPSQPTPKPDISLVKTPRPDITVGLRYTTVIQKMKAQGLRELEVKDFLKDLQYQQILCSSPLQPAHPMYFPPMVIEGKAYATGKPMFEAQNQAAVSGSCMINLQHKLAELTDLTSPGSYRGKDPLAFSICTEGTIMQLWVHYSRLVDDVRIYNMNALRICQISPHEFLQKGVFDFFKAVLGVMRWATSELVDEIVEQLVLLWNSGRQRTT